MKIKQTIFFFFVSFYADVQGRIFWNSFLGIGEKESAKRCGCSCGIPNRKGRLVGGNVAEINEYPWMVGLLFKGHFYCGGSLISDRYALTAAHCIHGVNVNSLNVLISEHMRSFPIETKSKIYKAVYLVYHPQFNRSTYHNDIGLVKVDKTVEYKWYARPVCLPHPNTNYVGELGVVTGWGRVSETGEPSDLLKEILVPIFPNNVCRSLLYKPWEIFDSMFCAGYVDGGTDSCHGDSGGGLFWQGNDGKYDIVGIVSWGQGCAQKGYPGVYIRVNNYLDWIEKHTKDSCFCGRREGRG